MKRADEYTLDFTTTRDGKDVQTIHLAVSRDGKDDAKNRQRHRSARQIALKFWKCTTGSKRSATILNSHEISGSGSNSDVLDLKRAPRRPSG